MIKHEQKATKSNKISLELSCRASLVNRGVSMKQLLPGFPILGCLTSKEDHGYVGHPNIHAAMHFYYQLIFIP